MCIDVATGRRRRSSTRPNYATLASHAFNRIDESAVTQRLRLPQRRPDVGGLFDLNLLREKRPLAGKAHIASHR